MQQKTKEQWKQVLISILVGAVVAFLTTLLEGLLEWLKGAAFITGPGIAMARYITKSFGWV